MTFSATIKDFIDMIKRDMYLEKGEDIKNFLIECFTDNIDLYMPIGHEDGTLFIHTKEKFVTLKWKRTSQDKIQYFLKY